MCPIHWATFALAAVPASLGLAGYVGFRMRLNLLRHASAARTEA